MFKTKQEIETWLKEYNIENYVINSDLSVDVDGNVNLYNKKLTHIPIQFNTVWGYFHCSDNSLTTLQWAPKEVGGDFYCWNNKFKTEPDHSFIKIGGNFKWERCLKTFELF